MSLTGLAVEFYVSPFDYITSKVRDWLIYIEQPYRCLGVYADAATAIKEAIHMAEYRVMSGKAAQVHMRLESKALWQTVWHSPDTTPRFP